MKLCSFFSGNWQIERTLDGKPYFKGVAAFSTLKDNNMILYHEEGHVTHPGGFKGPAFRDYCFLIQNTGFSVYFDQAGQQLFNQVDVTECDDDYAGSATHLCGQDTYLSDYLFLKEGRWQWNHKVNGPHKNFLLHAIYQRG